MSVSEQEKNKDSPKLTKPGTKKTPVGVSGSLYIIMCQKTYSLGPAGTRALPAALKVNFSKFLMKRAARSLAFSSHCAGSA